MSKLIQNTTPKERSQGCIFSELFRSDSDVESNGGTIEGTPTIDNGFISTRSVGSITYSNIKFDNVESTIFLEFTPNESSTALQTLFFSNPSGSRNMVYVNSTQNLSITIFGTCLGTIPQATFAPHWNVNQRNQLVITIKTGEQKVYLNGVLLETFTSAITPSNSSEFGMGHSSTFVDEHEMEGIYHRFKLFKRILSEDEILDIYDPSIEHSLVAKYRLSGDATDSSVNGNDGTVDGATFVNKGKFGTCCSFDGTDDKITIPHDDSLNLKNSDFAISMWVNNVGDGDLFNKDALGGFKLSTHNNKIRASFNDKEKLITPQGLFYHDEKIYISSSFQNKINVYSYPDFKFIDSFGSYGSGDTELNAPYGVFVNDDYIYVADSGNNRIVRYNTTTLEFVDKVGTEGTGNGEFKKPYDVYVYDDYLYVTDYNNHRIVKLAVSDLSYVSHIGGTAYGTGDDQFRSPYGITGDGTYLYVAEYSNHRIKKHLLSDLSYVSKIGSSGSGDDQFSYPTYIHYDDGYLYIGEISNYRFQKRNATDLSYVAKVGSMGDGEDMFNNLYKVLPIDDVLLVADTYNNRISIRNKTDLSYIDVWGSDTNTEPTLPGPTSIYSYGDYVYVSNFAASKIYKFRKDDLSYVMHAGDADNTTGDDQFFYPFQITGDGTYLYVVDNGNNRIKKHLLSDLSFVAEFGSFGTGNDQFKGPRGITYYDGYLYICDSSNHRIKKHNATDLSYVAHLGGTTSGSGDNQFNFPYFITNDGTYLYVSDASNRRIKKHLMSDLSYVNKTSGDAGDTFTTAFGVEVYDGYLYISQYSSGEIKKYNASDFTFINKIGEIGFGKNQYQYQMGIKIIDDMLWVGDLFNSRIVFADKDDLTYIDEYSNLQATIYSNEIPTGWNHIVFQVERDNQNSNLSLYVNGVLNKNQTFKTFSYLSNEFDANIGTLKDYYEGYIEDIRVYDRTLTTEEIRQLSKSPSKTISRKKDNHPNELVDGDMEASGTTAWTEINSPVVTKETSDLGFGSSQCLRITGTGVNSPRAAQTLSVGKKYRIKGYARSDGGVAPTIFENDGEIIALTNTTTWEYFDVTYTTVFGGRLDLGYSGTSINYVEFDNVQVIDLSKSYSPTVVHTDYNAKETPTTSAGFLGNTDFTVQSGSYKISTDTINGKTTKVIECVTTGALSIPTSYFQQTPTESAYGTWEFDVYKDGDANVPSVVFISNTNKYLDSGQNGYEFLINAAEKIYIRKITVGSTGNMMLSADDYVAIKTWYRIRITRSSSGTFTLYIKGGAFTDWTLVGAEAGANPVTDTSFTTSNYMVFNLAAGDKIAYSDISGGNSIKKSLSVE